MILVHGNESRDYEAADRIEDGMLLEQTEEEQLSTDGIPGTVGPEFGLSSDRAALYKNLICLASHQSSPHQVHLPA